MRHERVEEELEAYFAGRLEGAMGLRSWLGPWGDRQSPQGSRSTGSPSEPSGLALAAARDTNRVEGALALSAVLGGPVTPRVLAARYLPRGPFAPLDSYAPLGGVLEVIEGDVARLLAEHDDLAVRRALRSGLASRARVALEERAALDDLPVPMRLRGIEWAVRGPREIARHARPVHAALRRLAGEATRRALDVYREARAEWLREARVARLERYRAAVGA